MQIKSLRLIFHDLANQATTISLQSEMLKEYTIKNSETRKRINQLYKSSQQLNTLIIKFRKELQSK